MWGPYWADSLILLGILTFLTDNGTGSEYNLWSNLDPTYIPNEDAAENITAIAASSKYNVYVVTEQNKLYGAGWAKYGKVGENDVFEIPFGGVTAPSLNAVSVNQRSVCALVSEENSDSTMWCWGSKTFGQLGLEYQSNAAYSFGDAQDAWKLKGVIVNDYYDADGALLTQPTMSGVESQ